MLWCKGAASLTRCVHVAEEPPPPPPFARVATSPHRCSNEGFLTNRSLSAPLQICNWPMTLRGSIGSPLSALAQHFVVFVLANIAALMTHFLQASVALPAALTSFAMRLLIITWYQSSLWLVKASPWLWCTACLLVKLTPGPYYTAGRFRDMVFTSHFWMIFH